MRLIEMKPERGCCNGLQTRMEAGVFVGIAQIRTFTANVFIAKHHARPQLSIRNSGGYLL
jgi:phosphoribosylformylglycinamidine (FGAM) synthase-like amidotransferase family enzyme